MMAESNLTVFLGINCGEHRQDLDLSRPIGPQVKAIFADARIRFFAGVITAAYAVVNDVVIIYDGFTTGILCEYNENEGTLPPHIAGTASLTTALNLNNFNASLDKIRRFCITENGQVVFRTGGPKKQFFMN